MTNTASHLTKSASQSASQSVNLFLNKTTVLYFPSTNWTIVLWYSTSYLVFIWLYEESCKHTKNCRPSDNVSRGPPPSLGSLRQLVTTLALPLHWQSVGAGLTPLESMYCIIALLGTKLGGNIDLKKKIDDKVTFSRGVGQTECWHEYKSIPKHCVNIFH